MARVIFRLVTAAVIAAPLAGCAGHKDAGDYAKMSDDALCGSYGGDDSQRALVRAEIDKRSLIASYEWSQVSHGDIRYGMHRCAVLAAWHEPAEKVGGAGAGIEIWTYADDRIVRFQNGAVASATDFR